MKILRDKQKCPLRDVHKMYFKCTAKVLEHFKCCCRHLDDRIQGLAALCRVVSSTWRDRHVCFPSAAPGPPAGIAVTLSTGSAGSLGVCGRESVNVLWLTHCDPIRDDEAGAMRRFLDSSQRG